MLSTQRLFELRDDSDHEGPQNVHYIILFNVFYILGLVSLIAIVLTAWCSLRIQRASTWFMFIFSWLLTSLANLIILGQQTGPMPMFGVCLFQAVLEYGLPVFCSLSAVAFLVQVYLTVRPTVNSQSCLSRKDMILIHALPCLAFIGVLLEALILGLRNPDSIERHPSGMYCHLTLSIPSQITAAITIGAMISFMILGARVILILRRVWRGSSDLDYLRMHGYMSLDVVTRVVVFSFCPVIALAVSLLQYLGPFQSTAATSKMDLVLAVLPLVAGLIFGTQRDILRIWMVWKPRERDPATYEIKPATA